VRNQSAEMNGARPSVNAGRDHATTQPRGPSHLRRRLKVGLVGTFPPTECGIATFTSNTRDSILAARPQWEVAVVRLAADEAYEPAPDVVATWVRGRPDSLRTALRYLNTCDTVLIEHEFGIFDGADGESVLELVDGIRVPTVVVLHTVLREPSQRQYEIVQQLLDTVDLAVVPSTSALSRLRAMYRAVHATMVPHGATENFSSDGATRRGGVVLTWGLLGPGKGIESGIASIAKLAHLEDPPRYVVSGHTHPNERGNGDPYRQRLEELVHRYDVAHLVEFDNEYRDWRSLRALVRSADVVLLPYESRDQVCSGVLVESLASGKPIVATSFPHAVEMLADGAGILVDYDDVDAMAEALGRVLRTPRLAARMAARSRRLGEELLWPRVGEAMSQLLEEQFSMELVV
jgi:polysaccharide biosynthesis protein PslF